MAIFGLIPAAGSGARIGGEIPKQYRPVAGKPLLAHALSAFAATPQVAATFVVLAPGDLHFQQNIAATDCVSLLPVGGESRHATVLNGLEALAGRVRDDDWILVHDAARPGITPQLIDRLIAAVQADAVGGLLALPLADTLKREQRARNEASRGASGVEPGRIETSIAREGLWQAQTPQMFRYGLLCRALRAAQANGTVVTDEASAVEALGLKPLLVPGSLSNFKVTYPDDLALADRWLSTASAVQGSNA